MRHRDPEKENLDHTRAALAMCENIDWNVGRLLKLLDQLSLAEDTIVVVHADHGYQLGGKTFVAILFYPNVTAICTAISVASIILTAPDEPAMEPHWLPS